MAAKMIRKITGKEAEWEADKAANAKLRIVKEKAICDARVAKTKLAMAARIEPVEKSAVDAEGKVISFLLAHKGEWTSRKKKTIETTVAKMGFRKCSDTVIEDPEAVVAWARENGYTDVFEDVSPKIKKAALRKRIEAGEEVPGARVDSDFEPFCEPTKTLLDEAKKAE